MAQGIKEIPSKNAPGVEGGQKGGKIATTKSSSAAAIAKILAGISLPINKSDSIKICSQE